MLRFPPLTRGLSELNSDGVLPVGDYAPNRMEFERAFVDIGNHARRGEIYTGWNVHRKQLQLDGLSAMAWEVLDGSFTEATWEPGDIDIVVEYPITSAELPMLASSTPIFRLLQGP